MIGSELDAAGVRDPSLREAYQRCRAINARNALYPECELRALIEQRAPRRSSTQCAGESAATTIQLQ